MRRILGVILLSFAISTGYAEMSQATTDSETGIEIKATTDNGYLNIEISEELKGETITVSIFSSVGKIVLQETLETGLNSLTVSGLPDGEYVAVVRTNDVFKSKQTFLVS